MGVRSAQRKLNEARLAETRDRRRSAAGLSIQFTDLTIKEKDFRNQLKAFMQTPNLNLSSYDTLRELNKNEEFKEMIGDEGFKAFYDRIRSGFTVYMAIISYLTFEEVAILTRDLYKMYRDPDINNRKALAKIEEFCDAPVFDGTKPNFLLIPAILRLVSSESYAGFRRALRKHGLDIAELPFESNEILCTDAMVLMAEIASQPSAPEALDDFVQVFGKDRLSKDQKAALRYLYLSASPENRAILNDVRDLLNEKERQKISTVMSMFDSYPADVIRRLRELVVEHDIKLSPLERSLILSCHNVTSNWTSGEIAIMQKLRADFGFSIADSVGVEVVDYLASDGDGEEKLRQLKEVGFTFKKAKYGSQSMFGKVFDALLSFQPSDIPKVLPVVHDKAVGRKILDKIGLAYQAGIDNIGLAEQLRLLCGSLDPKLLEEAKTITDAEKKLALINKSQIFGNCDFPPHEHPKLLTLLKSEQSFIYDLCRLARSDKRSVHPPGLMLVVDKARSSFPMSESIVSLRENPRYPEIFSLGSLLGLKAYEIFRYQGNLEKALAVEDRQKLVRYVDTRSERLRNFDYITREVLVNLFRNYGFSEIDKFLAVYPSLEQAGVIPDPSVPLDGLIVKAKDNIISEVGFSVGQSVPLETLLQLRNADRRVRRVLARRGLLPELEPEEAEALMRRAGEFTISPFERNEGPRRDVILETINREEKRVDRFGNIWVPSGNSGKKILVSAHMDTTYGLSPDDYYFDFDGRNFIGTLDNSIGCAIVSLLAEKKDYPFDIDFVFTFSEETGNPSEMGAAKVITELRRQKVKVDLCITVDVTYGGDQKSKKLGYIESFNPPALAYVLKDVFRRSNAGSKLGGRQQHVDDEGSIVYGKEFPTFFVGPVMEGLNVGGDDKRAKVPLQGVEAVYVFMRKLLLDRELVKF
jgi:hypothetical protein